jgi:hypothetical protein
MSQVPLDQQICFSYCPQDAVASHYAGNCLERLGFHLPLTSPPTAGTNSLLPELSTGDRRLGKAADLHVLVRQLEGSPLGRSNDQYSAG